MHHASLYVSKKALPDFSHIDAVDFVEVTESKLSIATVRKLISQAYTQPLTPGGQRAILVVADQINIEAQNALLKIMEEPPMHTSFHFVISDHSRLLPTLLSRFYILAVAEQNDIAAVEEFIKMPVNDRLTLVAEKTAAKDTAWQQEIVSGIEQLCSSKRLPIGVAPQALFVKKHLQGPGASTKMLLEHLALSLPS